MIRVTVGRVVNRTDTIDHFRRQEVGKTDGPARRGVRVHQLVRGVREGDAASARRLSVLRPGRVPASCDPAGGAGDGRGARHASEGATASMKSHPPSGTGRST